ncbi:hypothetical protein [Kitasatospora sp. LaBMicrA B282]|uniref:hypothetical protein n=1 Tax=Kitasatospora sp. LaBMicrA B282 TaxID=3420949 RepID=UPI003D0E994A
MIPAGRTAADTATAAGQLSITLRWQELEHLGARPISRPGARIRYWDQEQLRAAVQGHRVPLVALADPEALYTVPVEDQGLRDLVRDYVTFYLTGAGGPAGVTPDAQIPPAGTGVPYEGVELVGLYAEDEPALTEGEVVDVLAKVTASSGEETQALGLQLRLERAGGRWVICALARADEEDLLDVEEARLAIPVERRPTASSWRTYTAAKADATKTAGPRPDTVIFGVRFYKRSTIRRWDREERFLRGEKSTGGRPAGIKEAAPRPRNAERNLIAEQRRERVRAMLHVDPGLTAQQVGTELGVSREWGRKLLAEVKAEQGT